LLRRTALVEAEQHDHGQDLVGKTAYRANAINSNGALSNDPLSNGGMLVLANTRGVSKDTRAR
jgi:hypothetical protein